MATLLQFDSIDDLRSLFDRPDAHIGPIVLGCTDARSDRVAMRTVSRPARQASAAPARRCG
eukprot:2784750-Alexandrium_andersonii.AAC.1